MNFKKELLGVYERVKKSSAIVLVVAIIVDTFCFSLLFAKEASGVFWWVILFGLVCGILTNIASYISSESGLGYYRKISKIQLPETQRARADAKLIFVTTLIIIILLQAPLANLRYKQITKNEKAYETEMENYNKTINSPEFKTRSQRDKGLFLKDYKPRYDDGNSNIIWDYLTLILPIFTSGISFVLGVRNKRRFDEIEKELEQVDREIDSIENEYHARINQLNEQKNSQERKIEEDRNRELNEISEKANSMLITARDIIRKIERAGRFSGLEKAILDEDIARTRYNELITQLDNQLEHEAPNLRKIHVKKPYEELVHLSTVIHKELSELAKTPGDLKTLTLESIEDIPGFKEKLNKLEACDES